MIHRRPAHSPDIVPVVVSIRDRHVPAIIPRRSEQMRMPVSVGATTEASACAFEDKPVACAGDRPRGRVTSAGMTFLAGSIAAGGVIGRFMFGHGIAGLLVGAVAGAVSVLPASGADFGFRTSYCCRQDPKTGAWTWVEEEGG